MNGLIGTPYPLELSFTTVFQFVSYSKRKHKGRRREKRAATKPRVCEEIPALRGERLACRLNNYFLTEIVQKEHSSVGVNLLLHEANCCSN